MNRSRWLKVGRGCFVKMSAASGDARGKIAVFDFMGAQLATTERWKIGLQLLDRLGELEQALNKFGRGRPWVKTDDKTNR